MDHSDNKEIKLYNDLIHSQSRKITVRNILLLIVGLSLIFMIAFYLLPYMAEQRFFGGIIKNNMDKNIDATAYFYSEVDEIVEYMQDVERMFNSKKPAVIKENNDNDKKVQ